MSLLNEKYHSNNFWMTDEFLLISSLLWLHILTIIALFSISVPSKKSYSGFYRGQFYEIQ